MYMTVFLAYVCTKSVWLMPLGLQLKDVGEPRGC